MKEVNKIDFVITWVDDKDEKWQKERNKYKKEKETQADAGACRYRDWDNLKYWFRSIEINAPWVNKIYFVTCGQIPDFLNLNNPKLCVINHNDYIPKEYLPTFSANPIELNFHRISGLSNQFVYFNDDTFLNSNSNPNDWFKNGKPRYIFWHVPPQVKEYVTSSHFIVKNDMEVINKHFSKFDVLKKGINKVASLKYGKISLENIKMFKEKQYQWLSCPHHAYPFLKTTYEDVWNEENELLSSVSSNKFRSKEDVNQYLFRYWDLARGNFSPYKPDYFDYSINTVCLKDCVNDIENGIHNLICINDNENCDDFNKCKDEILKAFKKRYPDKCSFEK